jgi:Lrp/AsnC family transcriptional regulator, leucine-responsive regulatory protein
MRHDDQPQPLDRVDRAIIRVLQVRGRESFAEIGKVVGLSATSVGDRVHRLEAAGFIEGYYAAISPEKLGYGLTAFILARPIGPDARFAKHAADRPEILECYRVTGDVNFVSRAVVSDIKHLERVLAPCKASCASLMC